MRSEGEMLFLMLIGVLLLGYGVFLKYQMLNASNELKRHQQRIKEQNESFLEQFRLGQDQLEELYSKQLRQISEDVAYIQQQLRQIQGGVLPFELQEREQQIRILLDRGKNPSEIADYLKISISEVLVLIEK